MNINGSAYLDYLHKFVPGTRVRILAKEDPDLSVKEMAVLKSYGKTGPKWTSKIFIVEGVDGYRVALEGYKRRFSPAFLQIIGEVVVKPIEKPVSELVRRKEGAVSRARKVIDADENVVEGKRLRKAKRMDEYEY